MICPIINQRNGMKTQKMRQKSSCRLTFVRFGCLFLFLGLLGFQEKLFGNTSAEDQWMTAYSLMASGNSHWEADDYVEAAENYRKAVELFINLRKDFPEWKADVVAFRLAYCRLKLADCESRLGDALNDLPKEELLRLLRLERERSRRLMEALNAEKEEKSDASKMAEENRQLRVDMEALELKTEKLARRLQPLEEKARKYDEARQELANVLMELEEYKEK